MSKNAKKLLKDATWKLVLKHGFKSTKVQDICKEAHVSKMTFYYYYENKHQIIEEVVLEFFDNAINHTREIMNTNMPFHDKIIDLVHWKADFVKAMSPQFVQELYMGSGKYVDVMKDVLQRTKSLAYDL